MRRAEGRPRDVITATELTAVTGSSAYDAIRQLRPEYLSYRNGRSPLVYLDYIRLGAIGELRQVALSQVAEIRYLNAIDATTRFGTGNTGGAIVIVSR